MLMRKMWLMAAVPVFVFGLAACEPEVGSDKWCEKMADTPKGDWSTNDAKAFAENCIFKTYGDEND